MKIDDQSAEEVWVPPANKSSMSGARSKESSAVGSAGRFPPRTIRGNGWKTSIRLEPEFWDAFAAVAERCGVSVGELAFRIRTEQPNEPLAPTIRLYLMEYYRKLAECAPERRSRARTARFTQKG